MDDPTGIERAKGPDRLRTACIGNRAGYTDSCSAVKGARMAKVPAHLIGTFEEDEEGECPPLAAAKIRCAEKALGYRLPHAYVELLKVCNGGNVRRRFFPTKKCPRWADDHVAFDTVRE